MAVNKVIYGGNTLVDLTGDTVTAADLADGVKATSADGNPIVGLMKKVTIDGSLSDTSTNPVQNKVIKEALDGKLGKNEIAAAAIKDGAGNNIVDTYAKKTDISGMVKSVNGKEPDAGGNVEVPTVDVSSIVNIIYPVGSLYWSKNSTDPATLFGGTWTRIKDKFILAAGDSYAQGATGGSATVTLTTAQLPAHNHSGSAQSNGSHSHSASSNSVGNHNHSIATKLDVDYNMNLSIVACGYSTSATKYTGDAGSHSHTITVNSGGAHTHDLTINNTGGGQAHENMPPYVAYYCWERTA